MTYPEGVALEGGQRKYAVSPSSRMNQMKLIFLVLVMGLLAWKFSPEVQSWTQARLSSQQAASQAVTAPKLISISVPVKCDGRKRCSQMTSCAEATSFLQNCPGMEMDGDHDGVPCESQWCR
ncbi:Excalibur calcium-binding domain protein [compost metagenome]